MRKLYLAILLAVVAVVTYAKSPTPTRESAASKAASNWLALTDSGKYDESWVNASPAFKAAVSETQWAKALTSVRAPLGSLNSREQESATFVSKLPGAPDGEYAVIKFATSFEHKASATETVTAAKTPDGSWKVAGYFIK